MMATLLSLAGHLLYITVLPFLIFKAMYTVCPSLDNPFNGIWFTILLPLALKNFLWLALISEIPFISMPSSIFETFALLVLLPSYLVCMTILSLLALIIAIAVCEAAASHPLPEEKSKPDWMCMIGLGTTSLVMDVFMKHSSHFAMIAILFFLSGYVLYVVCMMTFPLLVYCGVVFAFSVKEDTKEVLWITIFLPLTLKNFLWPLLISEFHPILSCTVSEMLATLVGLAGYLVYMAVLSSGVSLIPIIVCERASCPVTPEMEIIGVCANVVVMDVFINHSSHSIMVATLFSFTGYLVYVVFMPAISYLAYRGAVNAFPLLEVNNLDMFVAAITISISLALENFQWLALFSKFPFTFSQMITTLFGLAGYFFCVAGLSFLVLIIAILVVEIALWPDLPKKETPDWMKMIEIGVTVLVMDTFMKHSGHSNMMGMRLFAGYLVYIIFTILLSYLVFINFIFDDAIFPVLPFLRPVASKFKGSAPMFVAGVILVLNDIHGLAPFMKPAFFSEFICTSPFNFTDTLSGYIMYVVCMVALSFLLLITAAAAICRIRILWPMERPELMLTTIVGLTFMLLNMMWGTPFEKPSTHSDMKGALVGLAGYLIYIMCSIALSDMLSKSMTDTFVISLTFVLLDMFSISGIIAALVGHYAALVGLVWTITTSVLALLFLVAVSFVVSMGLHTWVAMLLPSAVKNYYELTFASIVGLSFKVMKIVLDIPAVEKLSLLSDMKAALLGIADLRNNYHVAYLVIRYLTVLSLPCLLLESRYTTSTYKLHTMTATIVAMGLVLTMSTSTPMPIKDLALQTMVFDDIIRRTVTSFVTHTILILATLIGGMVLYVRDQYPLWKLVIISRCREFKEAWMS